MVGVIGIQRQHQQANADAEEPGTEPVDTAACCGSVGVSRTRDGATPRQDPKAAEGGERQVEPEHETPPSSRSGRGGEGRAVEGTEHAAGFLQPGYRAERNGAPCVAVEVCGERQRERHQAAAAQALKDAAGHQPGDAAEGQQSRGGGDDRARREPGHA